jgi:hypothetical protein
VADAAGAGRPRLLLQRGSLYTFLIHGAARSHGAVHDASAAHKDGFVRSAEGGVHRRANDVREVVHPDDARAVTRVAVLELAVHHLLRRPAPRALRDAALFGRIEKTRFHKKGSNGISSARLGRQAWDPHIVSHPAAGAGAGAGMAHRLAAIDKYARPVRSDSVVAAVVHAAALQHGGALAHHHHPRAALRDHEAVAHRARALHHLSSRRAHRSASARAVGAVPRRTAANAKAGRPGKRDSAHVGGLGEARRTLTTCSPSSQ